MVQTSVVAWSRPVQLRQVVSWSRAEPRPVTSGGVVVCCVVRWSPVQAYRVQCCRLALQCAAESCWVVSPRFVLLGFVEYGRIVKCSQGMPRRGVESSSVQWSRFVGFRGVWSSLLEHLRRINRRECLELARMDQLSIVGELRYYDSGFLFKPTLKHQPVTEVPTWSGVFVAQ